MAVPPPPDPDLQPPDKTASRRVLRAARAEFVGALDAEALAGKLAAIDARLFALLDRPGTISGYVAHKGEPDILPSLLRIHHLGRRIALPHIVDSVPMTFMDWHPDAALTPGQFGIPQPLGEELEPDILLVPLIGFDRAGHRLGQGGGYYDRWFAAHPDAMRIGVGWSVQEMPAVPRDAWDMPLHAIVTEEEWICP